MKLYLSIYLVLKPQYLLLLGIEVLHQGLHHVLIVVVVATPLRHHAFIHWLRVMKGRRNQMLLVGRSVMLVVVFHRLGP